MKTLNPKAAAADAQYNKEKLRRYENEWCRLLNLQFAWEEQHDWDSPRMVNLIAHDHRVLFRLFDAHMRVDPITTQDTLRWMKENP